MENKIIKELVEEISLTVSKVAYDKGHTDGVIVGLQSALKMFPLTGIIGIQLFLSELEFERNQNDSK